MSLNMNLGFNMINLNIAPIIEATSSSSNQNAISSSSTSKANNASNTALTIPKGRSIRCQFCPQKYYSHYSVYISHLNHSHRQEINLQSDDIRIESQTFNNYDEFSRFKSQIEFQTETHFNKTNSRSDDYILFKCHRFGEPRCNSTQNRNGGKAKTIRIKTTQTLNKLQDWNWTKSCPAFMRAIKIENGKYWIEYCTFHLGHYSDGVNNSHQNQTSAQNNDTPNIIDSNMENKEKMSKVKRVKTESDDDDDCEDQEKENAKNDQELKNQNHKMVAITVPLEHRSLIETIVQLMKNEDYLRMIRLSIQSIIDHNSLSTNNTTDQQNHQSLRSSPRKRKQASAS